MVIGSYGIGVITKNDDKGAKIYNFREQDKMGINLNQQVILD